jgi:type II secretory pathway pseudopilin PulG
MPNQEKMPTLYGDDRKDLKQKGFDVMFKTIESTRGSKGMTLVEILISVCVIIVVIIGGLYLLSYMRGTPEERFETVQVQQDARTLVENMARELSKSVPNLVVPDPMINSDFIAFYTPGDGSVESVPDKVCNTDWQRYVKYMLDRKSNRLYKFVSYVGEPETQIEIMATNVQQLLSTRKGDVVTISMRTLSDQSMETGNVAHAYTDFCTEVKLRNHSRQIERNI